MTPIRWTSEAADQLGAIVNYIRKDNPQAARTLAQFILAVSPVLRLSRTWVSPESGKAPESW